MELCLVGLFFLVRDADDAGNAVGTPCKGQAIIMIICLAFTVIYQYLLNRAFAPLFRVSRSNRQLRVDLKTMFESHSAKRLDPTDFFREWSLLTSVHR